MLSLLVYYVRKSYANDSQYGKYLIATAIIHLIGSHIYFFTETKLDSYTYFLQACQDQEVGFNSRFISVLVRQVVKFHLDYYTINLLFASFSFISFTILYRMLKPKKKTGKYLLIFAFVPSLHYWSTVLSKEAIIMTLIMTSLCAVRDIERKWWLFVVSLLFIAFMRPHISALLFLTGLISTTTSLQLSYKYKLFLLGSGLCALFIFCSCVLHSFGYGSVSYAMFLTIVERWEHAVGYYPVNSSNIPLANMGYPLKVFTFLFRPLFEIWSYKVFVASFENVFILAAFLSLIRKSFIIWLINSSVEIRYAASSFVAFVAFMALVSSNFGYAMRQKSTFLLFFIFIFISFWMYQGSDRESKNNFSRQ